MRWTNSKKLDDGMPTRGRGRWAWATLVLALLLLMAACGGGGETTGTTAEPSAEMDDVLFLTDFTFYGYTAPWFAGVEEGIFETHGINLTIQPGENSVETVVQIGAKSAQFGLADPLSVVRGISEGTEIRMIAAHWQKHVAGMCYLADNPHDTPADFADDVIAGNPEDAYERILLQLMEEDGVDTSGIVFEDMSNEAATAALFTGNIDSHACGRSTFPQREINAAAEGFELRNFVFTDQGFDAIGHSIIVHQDLIDENPDLVQRFIDAYAEAVVWSQQNVDAAVQHYVDNNPATDSEAARAAYVGPFPNHIDTEAQPNDGQFTFPTGKIQFTVELSNEWYGLDVAVDDAYTNEYVLNLSEELRSGDSLTE